MMLHVFCSLNLPGRANQSVSLRLKEKKPWFCGWCRFFFDGNVCSAIGDLQKESLFCLKMFFFLRRLQRCTAEADSVLVAVSLAECLQLKRLSVEPCQRSSSSSSSKNTCCGFPLIVFVIVSSVYWSHEYRLFSTSLSGAERPRAATLQKIFSSWRCSRCFTLWLDDDVNN